MYKGRKEDSDNGIQYSGYMEKEMGFSMYREWGTAREDTIGFMSIIYQSVLVLFFTYIPPLYTIWIYLGLCQFCGSCCCPCECELPQSSARYDEVLAYECYPVVMHVSIAHLRTFPA